MVIASPWRVVDLIPDPLEVGRKRARPRRGGQQIAPKLEGENLQPGIGLPSPVALQPFVGGQSKNLLRDRPKVQRERPEKPALLLLMLGKQLCIRPCGRCIHCPGQRLVRVGSTPTFAAVGQVGGFGSQHQRDGIAILEPERSRRKRIGGPNAKPGSRSASLGWARRFLG